MNTRTYPYPQPKIPALNRGKLPRTPREDLNRWLIRNSLRWLLARNADGLETLGVEELAFWLEKLARAHSPHRFQHPYDAHTGGSRKGSISTDELELIVAKAAEFALDVFDPEAIRRRARAGGRKSKRGPSFTPEQLAAVAHLSNAEAADQLGCSSRTITRLRASQRRVEEPDAPEVPKVIEPVTVDLDRLREEREASLRDLEHLLED